MSSNATLNQDFGSESEDDNFNPAPADESDNEIAGDEERSGTNPDLSTTTLRQSDPNTVKQEDGEGSNDSATRRNNTRPFNGPGLAEEDEGEELNGDGGEVEEDEEGDDLDEDDDDEEEVVSVSTSEFKALLSTS